MQLQLLTVASLCAKALAAPAPAVVPQAGALGTLQALHYNNLGPENNGTSAVFVHDKLNHAAASARCAAIGERLYPLPAAPLANRTELDYQFDYLLYSESIQASADVWVSANSSGCLAYSLEQKDFVSAPCSRKLSALCTSGVPPTTDKNRAVVPSSKIAVASHDYTITGFRDARSFRFLGIPFANAPVNALRLAPPQPYTGAKQIEATQWSASCIQSDSPFGTLDSDISEDCLYLNVYTPAVPSGRNITGKPVAVYFYGGAFTKGSASMIDYDGGNFASRNDVIVVTVNYRVGVLGWLTTGNLTTGNYGTRDQILALHWVQRHIAAFGGDPSRVTIFGQSAGGQSVVALLSSPAAAHLFSAAIVQSAPVDLPWFTRDVYTDLIVPHLAPALGCPHHTTPEASLVACLRSLPASAFLDNSTAFESGISAAANATASGYLHASPMLASIEPLLPILDPQAGVIADQFHSLLGSSNSSGLNKVPTLFTTVADEAALYVPEYASSMKPSPAALSALLSLAFPPALAKPLLNVTTSELQSQNTKNNTSLLPTLSHLLTSSEWTCPLSSLLHLTQQSNQPHPEIYNIQFPKGHIQTNLTTPPTCSPSSKNEQNSTCHAADVLPIWGTLNSKTRGVDPYYGPEDVKLAQLMQDVFGAFFRTQDPNPARGWFDVSGKGQGRGEAYAFSRGVFYGHDEQEEGEEDGYRITPVGKGDKEEVNLLGLKPSTIPEFSTQKVCQVFEEAGFTFNRAELV